MIGIIIYKLLQLVPPSSKVLSSTYIFNVSVSYKKENLLTEEAMEYKITGCGTTCRGELIYVIRFRHVVNGSPQSNLIGPTLTDVDFIIALNSCLFLTLLL